MSVQKDSIMKFYSSLGLCNTFYGNIMKMLHFSQKNFNFSVGYFINFILHLALTNMLSSSLDLHKSRGEEKEVKFSWRVKNLIQKVSSCGDAGINSKNIKIKINDLTTTWNTSLRYRVDKCDTPNFSGVWVCLCIIYLLPICAVHSALVQILYCASRFRSNDEPATFELLIICWYKHLVNISMFSSIWIH